MASVTKKIKFQYAILIYEDQDGVQKKFDFEAWLKSMNEVPYEKRAKRVYANLIRLDKCQEKDERDGLIGFRFLRLRDSNLPYKVPTQEEAQDLGIADDEFIGESLHMVYDSNTRYFMIQVNRYSASINGLAAYINQTNADPEKTVRFKLFHKDLDITRLKFNRYKKFEIGLANVGALKNELSVSSLGSMLNLLQNYEGHTLKIEVGIGHSRKRSLNNKQVEAVVHEIPKYSDIVTSANIKYCEGDSEKGEYLNLLDCLEESILSMQILERKTLDFDYTINIMKQEYLNKKKKLDTMLRQN